MQRFADAADNQPGAIEMKPVKQDQTPEVSGGIVITDCEPVPIDTDPLPYPGAPGPYYPTAPIVPVIDEPFTTIKL
jgi:hypothetical protein